METCLGGDAQIALTSCLSDGYRQDKQAKLCMVCIPQQMILGPMELEPNKTKG